MFIEQLKKAIKSVIPPFLAKTLNRLSPYGFHGNYNWYEAVKICNSGYNTLEVIEKTFLRNMNFLKTQTDNK